MAARELRQGQEDRAALERERASILGQLEAARRGADLDLDALCRQARANLEAPTPETRRLAFEALGVKVKVTGREVLVSLALPVDAGPDRSFALPFSRRGGKGVRLNAFISPPLPWDEHWNRRGGPGSG